MDHGLIVAVYFNYARSHWDFLPFSENGNIKYISFFGNRGGETHYVTPDYFFQPDINGLRSVHIIPRHLHSKQLTVSSFLLILFLSLLVCIICQVCYLYVEKAFKWVSVFCRNYIQLLAAKLSSQKLNDFSILKILKRNLPTSIQNKMFNT